MAVVACGQGISDLSEIRGHRFVAVHDNTIHPAAVSDIPGVGSGPGAERVSGIRIRRQRHRGPGRIGAAGWT